MCRLLGVVVNKEVDFQFSLLGSAQRNLRTQSEHNPDGWGIAFFREQGGVSIKKAPQKASGDQMFDQTAYVGVGRMMIAHIRKASSGSSKIENTHPFGIDDWAFAHNGTIKNERKLEKYYEPSYDAQVEGDTDSERFFAIIISQFAKDCIQSDSEIDSILQSLMSSIRIVRDEVGGNGLNFLLSDGRCLFAYRNGRELYYLIRDPDSAPEPQLRSNETGALLCWKKASGERAVILATEEVTESEDWKPVQENELICVDRNLCIEKKTVP